MHVDVNTCKKSSFCKLCMKQLSDRRSLRRHMQAIHKIYPEKRKYSCAECKLETGNLMELEAHMLAQHRVTTNRHCFYCNCCYLDKLSYTNHMHTAHGLPVWTGQESKTDAEEEEIPFLPLSEKSFGGALKIYNINVGDNEKDLMHVMKISQQKIQSTVRWNTQTCQYKVQFTAELLLTKPSCPVTTNSEKEQPQLSTLFLNSDMIRVDFTGISDDQYMSMVDQMIQTLVNFASHGSGWMVANIARVELRLVRSPGIGSQTSGIH